MIAFNFRVGIGFDSPPGPRAAVGVGWGEGSFGGKARAVSQRMQLAPHSGITRERVVYVLEHWVIRGIRTERDGSRSWCYLAFLAGINEIGRVAISMDDKIILTGFPDRTATRP